eukprot:CAMPEP_0171640172 /NCGR_PEP_ID=MMETSP0990-20121206/30255_1 /TAXON_ID=483369 /ORGANISM="non described non described, Strain CCMP2098" /LENGTH=159 /DNA_ID=CAMNT_0012214259 /DNA_START=73 /DNA_END=550 /DNA_ORIENTATION=+
MADSEAFYLKDRREAAAKALREAEKKKAQLELENAEEEERHRKEASADDDFLCRKDRKHEKSEAEKMKAQLELGNAPKKELQKENDRQRARFFLLREVEEKKHQLQLEQLKARAAEKVELLKMRQEEALAYYTRCRKEAGERRKQRKCKEAEERKLELD